MLINQIIYKSYIAKRLRHLIPIKLEHTIMYPVSRIRSNVICFIMHPAALCKLILMMWKNKILSTGVNIKRNTKCFLRHSGTLKVPPRTTKSPGRIPTRLILIARFPKHKVCWIFFVRSNLYPTSGDLLLFVPSRK